MDTSCKILLLFTGITGLFGFDELSKGKIATQSSVYACNPPCGPDKAVDDDRKTCMRTYGIGTSSSYKTVWWALDLGGSHSIYSISINFKDYREYNYEMRQRGRFAGFSLYISNTLKKEDGKRCYKNSLPLPPLDFNTTCIGYGRYVIFYNERLDRVTYPEGYQIQTSFTELCEVKVQGCTKAGVYGNNCSIPCPINCHEQRCNIVNGTCLGCAPGYVGEMCKDECAWGWYDVGCKRQCTGYCRGNISCNHVTGHCDGRCAAGWMEKQCDQQCKDGTYGPGCIHNCSGHCLNGTFCKKENGFCEMGCNPGFNGVLCNEPCPSGIFGQNCDKRCSNYCRNRICDHIDGTCIEGCSEGYTGIRCFNRCPNSTFGIGCENTCSKNCISTCSHIDGQCDCLPGYKGSPNCTTECSSGFFGVNCQYKCSGHCVNGETCSRFDGSCPHGCQPQYRGLTCDYQDETSTGQWRLGFSMSVALNIIFIFVTAVVIILRRKGAINFTEVKKSYRSPGNSDQTNEGSADTHTTTEKPFYEELNSSENINEYRELQVKSKIAYENLALTNA